ncbi:MAG: superoxide dismutase [Planctomycetota bacterium]
MTDQPITRRTALTSLAVGAGSVGLAACATARPSAAAGASSLSALLTQAELGFDPASKAYTLPDLPYAYDALEPAIDEQTMTIHHSKHHAGYVRGLNRALAKLAEIRDGTGDASLIKHWSRELSFHGSGHVNHALFWLTMGPDAGGIPAGDLASHIDRSFGSFNKFKAHFSAAARAVEGSGWAWLVYEPAADHLMVIQGEKQQDMMITGVVPLLGIDVWEHAYYLRYQNRRADYVDAWWDVVDWSKVAELHARALV